MPWLLALIVIGLGLWGLRSGKHVMRLGAKPRREWCVLTFEEDESGNIALVDKVPLMRTSEKRKFKWLVVAESTQEYTITISEFTKDGKRHDLFSSSHLEGDIPTSQENEPLRLDAKLKAKGEFEKGVYSYKIAVRRKGAASLRLEESGELEPCPVWPCDGE